jgi:hypothetical protein
MEGREDRCGRVDDQGEPEHLGLVEVRDPGGRVWTIAPKRVGSPRSPGVHLTTAQYYVVAANRLWRLLTSDRRWDVWLVEGRGLNDLTQATIGCTEPTKAAAFLAAEKLAERVQEEPPQVRS